VTTPPAVRTRWLVPIVVVLAVLLVCAGGALAVVTGIGRPAVPTEGSVDVGFARDMSTHHRQAVTMAGLARDRTDDDMVRTLAFDIETSQNNQVGMMQGWLQVWDVPVNSAAELMAWMSGGDHAMQMTGNLMPGMATNDELAELRGLSGTDLDVRFLQLMIRHHQGGVQMASYAADHASEDAVRRLARSMVTMQSAEIAAMEQMIVDRGGSTLPPS